jgi:hypothetical protein
LSNIGLHRKGKRILVCLKTKSFNKGIWVVVGGNNGNILCGSSCFPAYVDRESFLCLLHNTRARIIDGEPVLDSLDVCLRGHHKRNVGLLAAVFNSYPANVENRVSS